MSTIRIRILRGDTFNAFAEMVGVAPYTLQLLNRQVTNPANIKIGQFLQVPDNENTRRIAAARSVGWEAMHTQIPNTKGEWGAWPKTPSVPDSGDTEAKAPAATPAIFSNPWVLGGIGAVLIAILMGKKGR